MEPVKTSIPQAPMITSDYPFTVRQRECWSAMWAQLADGRFRSAIALSEYGSSVTGVSPGSCREILRRAVLAGLLVREGRATRLETDSAIRVVAFYRRLDAS